MRICVCAIDDHRSFNLSVVLYEPNSITSELIVLAKISEFSCHLGFEVDAETICN